MKQHLAAIRMLCDWLIVSQVLPVNSAAAVRGPKHVVTKGRNARLGVAAIAVQPHLDTRPQRQPPTAEGEAPRALETVAHCRSAMGETLHMIAARTGSGADGGTGGDGRC